ncbi:hypothetical protein D3C72_2409260 [compost metagenome]
MNSVLMAVFPSWLEYPAFPEVRRGAVEIVVADDTRLVGKRIVVVDRADVAPVAIEIPIA